LKIEHMLMVIVIALLLYLLFGGYSYNGFAVGSQDHSKYGERAQRGEGRPGQPPPDTNCMKCCQNHVSRQAYIRQHGGAGNSSANCGSNCQC
jgi:hypothetical protein